jgi:hypothetical protein
MTENDNYRQSEESPDDEQQNNELEDQGDNVPVTGDKQGLMDAPIEEVSMSDLVDLSDIEEMEDYADSLDPLDTQDLIDTDAEEMAKYTDDNDIVEDLADRQSLATGTDQLLNTMKEYTEQSPDLTGQDVDADWWSDHQSGEESVGGSVATPEQNIVDDLGKALGVEYNDFEPLDTEDLIAKRDENRWELNAESADDDETQADYANDKSKQTRSDDPDDSDEVNEDFRRIMNEDSDETDADDIE